MTASGNSDTLMTLAHDTLHVGHLTPIDRAIFDQGWRINTDSKNLCPFCVLDFPYPKGSVRNSLSRLRAQNLIYVVIKGHPTFYACEGSGIPVKSMTLTHMVGSHHIGGLEELLLSLSDAVAAVHDIRLLFNCPEFYSNLDLMPCSRSRDKRLSPMNFPKGRIVRVVAHITGFTSVIVSCSTNPFPRDNLAELIFILDIIRGDISFKYLNGSVRVPPISDWVVTAWHYNKNGDEIAGKNFEVTLSDFAGVLYRFYSKSTTRSKFRPRLEKIESPRKTLMELAKETLDGGSVEDLGASRLGRGV